MLKNVLVGRVVVTFAVLLESSIVAAQSTVMPIPVAVVKDGAGKTVGQVVGYRGGSEGIWPMVMLDIDGTPGFFVMQQFGLVDRNGSDGNSGISVYFSGAGCTGDAALNYPIGGIEAAIGTIFGVVGPYPTLGNYEVYRSTGDPPAAFSYQSMWANGACLNSSGAMLLLPGEAIVPSPLEGFVGPTVAEPDRFWTVEGGTTIIPPPP
jgi:hypothetical protein